MSYCWFNILRSNLTLLPQKDEMERERGRDSGKEKGGEEGRIGCWGIGAYAALASYLRTVLKNSHLLHNVLYCRIVVIVNIIDSCVNCIQADCVVEQQRHVLEHAFSRL